MNNIISLKNINKEYYSDRGELVAIDNISIDIKEGEYVAIVGPSGCGKSTLLNIIGGINKQNSGEIIMDPSIKIGYMLQEDSLFDWLTILDNCLLGLKIKGELTTKNIKYVEELINTYGLSEFINSYPSSLSGGMRQRVLRILYTHK